LVTLLTGVWFALNPGPDIQFSLNIAAPYKQRPEPTASTLSSPSEDYHLHQFPISPRNTHRKFQFHVYIYIYIRISLYSYITQTNRLQLLTILEQLMHKAKSLITCHKILEFSDEKSGDRVETTNSLRRPSIIL
jgi:hypothetical protein